MTVAKQVLRSPLPGASAQTIGRSNPLGASVVDGGVNFSLFSRTATGVELLLFDREDDARPSRVIPIDPLTKFDEISEGIDCTRLQRSPGCFLKAGPHVAITFRSSADDSGHAGRKEAQHGVCHHDGPLTLI